jgi:hypothetical protein
VFPRTTTSDSTLFPHLSLYLSSPTMPRRKVREYQAKKLLSSNITSYFPLTLRCAQVTPSTDFGKLLDDNHWLESERLVVKPDMLFGKRGKNNLVLLNATYPEAQKFIEERINKSITIGMRALNMHSPNMPCAIGAHRNPHQHYRSFRKVSLHKRQSLAP